MARVQIVYASRHGGNAGIAERIAEVLRAEGSEVILADAAQHPDPQGFDAYIVGSGIYMGSWLKEATEFLEHNKQRSRPGESGCSAAVRCSVPRSRPRRRSAHRRAGPRDRTSSGGRKKVEALSAAVGARGHEVFLGAFDPSDPPKSMAERLVRLMPAAKRVLPAGDFRDWEAIAAWARQIAAQLLPAVRVA